MDATTNHMNPFQIGVIDRFSRKSILSGVIRKLPLILNNGLLRSAKAAKYLTQELWSNSK